MRKPRGYTLMEMLVVIAMMGVTMYLGRIGLQLLFNLQHQGMRLQSQREAQAMLYLIAKDVRNAKSIETREVGKLVLNAFDLSRGFDVNDGLNLTTSGTITYEYKTDPQGSYLERTAVFGPNTTINKYLRGVLIPPTATDFIFEKPLNDAPDLVCPPCSNVTIALRYSGFANTTFRRVYQYTAKVRAYIE